MKNRIKHASSFFISALILIVTISILASAEPSYRIYYDYGSADIRSEYIINLNPNEYDGTTLILSNPECNGFEFDGWYSDITYTNRITSVESSSDITVYAKWYEKNYTIRYVTSFESVNIPVSDITNMNQTSMQSSELVTLSDLTTTLSQYTFDGWYSDTSYSDKVTSIKPFTCSEVTLYAKWVNARYNITYNMGDAEQGSYSVINNNPLTYEYSVPITLVSAETDNPAYTFAGWYSDENLTIPIDEIAPGTTGNVTLFAKWDKNEFGINYVLYDNSGVKTDSVTSNNPSTRTATQNLLLNNAESTDRRFLFDGWFTNKSFNEDSRITEIPAETFEDVTLYAKWKTAVYNITYDYGKINTQLCPIENLNSLTYEYSSKPELRGINADGFIFNGWCTDKNLTNHITILPEDTYGDITLYADFTEKTYAVNYILDDREVTASQVTNPNPSVRLTSESLKIQKPTTLNFLYAFDGWYLDPEFTQETDYIKAYTTKSITLYAKWVRIVSYTPVWGDASLSGGLTSADSRQVLRYSAQLENFNDIQMRISDINNDGEVTSADARIILRLSANLENEAELIKRFNLPSIKLIDGEVVFE